MVFFEGREAIGFDRMKAKGIWQCRHGAFHHDEIVGKPFGSRVSQVLSFFIGFVPAVVCCVVVLAIADVRCGGVVGAVFGHTTHEREDRRDSCIPRA